MFVHSGASTTCLSVTLRAVPDDGSRRTTEREDPARPQKQPVPASRPSGEEEEDPTLPTASTDAAQELERAKLEVERQTLRADEAELQRRSVELDLRTLRAEVTSGHLEGIHKYQLLRQVVNGTKWLLTFPALWIDIRALQPIAGDFAGKSTRLTGSLTISLVFSLVVTASFGVSSAWAYLRKNKIKRLRSRVNQLESELEDASRQIKKLEAAANKQGPKRSDKR